MRTFLKASFPAEAANRAVSDGRIAKIIQDFMVTAKPEAACFTVLGGKRSMIAIFDLPSASAIPTLLEPLFQGLNAEIEFAPAMDAADLQKGLASL